MENKKIKNVKTREFDGIKFRSDLELRAYKVLKASGLNFSYEPESEVLLKGFKCDVPRFIKGKWCKEGEKLRDWTYTPDFVIETDSKKIYVEMKGFGNDTLPLKRKMFLYKLCLQRLEALFQGKTEEYWEIYKISELEKLVKEL